MYLSSVSSRLLLYETNCWDLKKSYGCYDGILRDISWSDDSKYLLQVNGKGLIEILSPADHEVRSLQHIPLKDTWSASFHRDGHRNIGIGTKSGNVMIWDTKNKTITKSFPSPSQQSVVNHVSYNAKNTSLAATMHNGDTIIYGLVSNIPVLTVRLSSSKSISAMKFHHESRSLLGLATEEGHVVLRDITTNKDKVFFENVHASPVSDFAYSQINRDVLLSCGFDKVMHVYDVRLQNVVSSCPTTQTLTSITVNTENLVALGTKNRVVLVYDLRELTKPLNVLKGHEEEVRKVAFQPVRKKTLSADASLREDTEKSISQLKASSPCKTRTSELFYVTDTPPKNVDISGHCGENRDDSFLVMMGLNKSIDEDDEVDKSVEKEREKFNVKFDEKLNTSTPPISTQASTPINSRTVENLCFSPQLCTINGIPDDGTRSDNNASNLKQNGAVRDENSELKAVEELKDFIKLTLSDVADDNRNYFLHIMMALTKQKLFLEKQLSGMNEQMRNLVHNQNVLVETNRKLALEMDQLKSQKNYF